MAACLINRQLGPAAEAALYSSVRGILAGTPRADDMELIAAELASNAIRRTPSGYPGGEFTITIRTGTGWARIEVSDIGTGEWHPQPGDGDPGAEYGRGLAIIVAVAEKFGHDVLADGQTLWAEVAWPDTDQA